MQRPHRDEAARSAVMAHRLRKRPFESLALHRLKNIYVELMLGPGAIPVTRRYGSISRTVASPPKLHTQAFSSFSLVVVTSRIRPPSSRSMIV